VLALLSITHGHPTLGLAIVLVAKVLGTALVARIYALTRRSLLSLDWFQRYHDPAAGLKARLTAQLQATAAGSRCSDDQGGGPPSGNRWQAGRPHGSASARRPHACCACCAGWWPACGKQPA
jgi:hypothetical protein